MNWVEGNWGREGALVSNSSYGLRTSSAEEMIRGPGQALRIL